MYAECVCVCVKEGERENDERIGVAIEKRSEDSAFYASC